MGVLPCRVVVVVDHPCRVVVVDLPCLVEEGALDSLLRVLASSVSEEDEDEDKGEEEGAEQTRYDLRRQLSQSQSLRVTIDSFIVQIVDMFHPLNRAIIT